MAYSTVDEGRFLQGRFEADGENLILDTKNIYDTIFSLMGKKYPYLIKCHNSVPNILGREGTSQRYHLFNAGRRAAFEAANYTHKPAACALGAIGSKLEVNFLAGVELPQEFENPRQTSAFNYPREYGPAPLFSRGVFVDGQLYISGTASIIGHDTVHIGNFMEQMRETLDNVRNVACLCNVELSELNFIIYVKNAGNLEKALAWFPYDAQYVVCDLCRDNLLIEIEATTKNGKRVSPIYA